MAISPLADRAKSAVNPALWGVLAPLPSSNRLETATSLDFSERRIDMTVEEKCAAIVESIVDCCNARMVLGNGEAWDIAFGSDAWGGNTLTVFDRERGHSHIGVPDGTFEDLVDGLHALLCLQRGLSWSK